MRSRRKYAVAIISTDLMDLLQRPPVKAWRELRPDSPEPTQLTVLKEGKVYRIDGVGPGGSPIVAKACPQTVGWPERVIYQDLLPRLALPSVRCYGFVKRNGDESGWLFLEDAGGEPYVTEVEEHRILGARWLGALHASAHRVCEASAFPGRDLDHYRKMLRPARADIVANRTNPALRGDDVALLDAIVDQCGLLESRWSVIETSCAWMPRSVVHGDFVAKNLRLRQGPDGTSVVALDWETAGWGIICPDLVSVDLPAYWAIVRDAWPCLDLDAVRQMGLYGVLLRRIAAIYWEATFLSFPWPQRTMRHFQSYHATLDDCIRTVGLTD